MSSVSAQSHVQLLNSSVGQLSGMERADLRSGRVVVTGEQGEYVGRVAVTASMAAVWSVLTDYPRFSQFLPNVASSRVVEVQGEQKLIEQIDERRVLVLSVRSRVLSAITEVHEQRIMFRRVEGDVPKLEGYWSIEPLAAYAGAPADQVLITQVVAVAPVENVPTGMFYSFFKHSLKDNLTAIRQEVVRRRGDR
jgi:ribosome-associated toxin RatA of RatAB toxin-antitoxin module